MIVFYHDGKKVKEIVNTISNAIINSKKKTIAATLVELAMDFPDDILVWCHVLLKTNLNVSEVDTLFHHKKNMFSYNPTEGFYIDKNIGFVDGSPFLNVNKKVTYPTWQMSAWVGAIHSEVILAIQKDMPVDNDFDYFLSSLAKLGMPKGLFCYSESNLLKTNAYSFSNKNNCYTLFRFVKQHYKTQWVFFLFFSILLYQKKFPIAALLSSLFYKNRVKLNLNLDAVAVQSTKKIVLCRNIDVIIPTIGRSGYLYNVLKDFSKQTLKPLKIIIIEQNPKKGSLSELDYLASEKWPFKIEHVFTHQAGACNARSIALDKTSAEWVFLADDDNRFEPNLLSDVFDNIEKYGAEVVTIAYPQEKEIKKYRKIIQWPTFGAGNSFVKRDLLQHVRFNPALEFGYGEDGDFGMQLRNQGVDILYLPEPEIVHLKAPIGGFRTTPELQWQNETIQPKPSPTIMLYQLMHSSQEQIKSYKTILFFKYYQLQKIKNPLKYYKNFQKQWDSSVFWANKLRKQHEV